MREIFISIDEINFRIITQNFPSESVPLVLLHGFAGSANIWKFLFNQFDESQPFIAIDLIGHGQSSSPTNPEFFTEESQIYQLNKIIEKLKIDKMILLGYSMGGRLALSYALNNKSKIEKLILESATAGIEDEKSRKIRYLNDMEIAEKIAKVDLTDFFKDWYSLPIFSSLRNNPEKLDELIKRKSANNKQGLINSLTGFSTGKMKSYWNELKTLNIPVLLVCGELDKKYHEINLKMTSQIPNSELKIIAGVGHITHLEKPLEFISFVKQFLQKRI